MVAGLGITQRKSLTPKDINKRNFLGMSLNNNTYATKKTIAQVQKQTFMKLTHKRGGGVGEGQLGFISLI